MWDNYFTLFGLKEQFVQNMEVIQSRYYQLQQSLHPDQFVGKSSEERDMALSSSAMINEAYQILKDPFLRARYLLKRQGKFWADEMSIKPNMPMELVMEQMALRETFEDLQANPHDADDWQAYKTKVYAALSDLFQQLQLLDNPNADEMALKVVFQQIPFYLRLKSTIENHENNIQRKL